MPARRFENSDIQLTVHEIRITARLAPYAWSSFRSGPIGPEASSSGDPEGYSSIFRATGHQQLQIDVLDANDRLIPWFQSIADAENSHVTLTLTSPIQTPRPRSCATIRWLAPKLTSPSSFPTFPCRESGPAALQRDLAVLLRGTARSFFRPA